MRGQLIVGEINDVVYSPEGNSIGLASNPLPEIVDTVSKTISCTLLGQNGTMNTIDISNTYTIIGTQNGTISLWSNNGSFIKDIEIGTEILKIRFNSKGDKIALVTTNKELILMSIPDFKNYWKMKLDTLDNHPINIEWSSNDNKIALIHGSSLKSLTIIDTILGEENWIIYDNVPENLMALTWNADSVHLSVALYDNRISEFRIEVWDTINKIMLNYNYRQNGLTYSIAWISNTDFIVGGIGSAIYVWWANFSEYQRINIDVSEVLLIAASPNSKDFVAITKNGAMFFFQWDSSLSVERPSIEISHPVNNEVVQDVIEINGLAWGPNVIVEVRIKIDNNRWYVAQGTTTWSINMDGSFLGKGSHTITAISYDGLFFSMPETIEIIVAKKTSDYEIEMGFTTPSQNSIISDQVDIRGYYLNDAVPNPSIIQISIDDDDWFEIEPARFWKSHWNSTEVINGLHIIFARAYDGTKWSTPVSLIIQVYNENSPNTSSLTIEYPLPGMVVNNSINIKGKAHFNSGEPEIQIQFNSSGIWYDAYGSKNWNYTLDTDYFPDGSLYIEVQATNGINKTINKDLIVFINNNNPNNPPTISIYKPQNGEVLYELKEIEGTAWDDAGVDCVFYRIDKGPWIQTTGKSSWSVDTSDISLEKGTHNIEARSFDGKYYSETKRISITILKPPDRNGNNPPHNTTVENSSSLLWIIIIVIILFILLYIILNNKKDKKNKGQYKPQRREKKKKR